MGTAYGSTTRPEAKDGGENQECLVLALGPDAGTTLDTNDGACIVGVNFCVEILDTSVALLCEFP